VSICKHLQTFRRIVLSSSSTSESSSPQRITVCVKTDFQTIYCSLTNKCTFYSTRKSFILRENSHNYRDNYV